jgi:hypothetical protein
MVDEKGAIKHTKKLLAQLSAQLRMLDDIGIQVSWQGITKDGVTGFRAIKVLDDGVLGV